MAIFLDNIVTDVLPQPLWFNFSQVTHNNHLDEYSCWMHKHERQIQL